MCTDFAAEVGRKALWHPVYATKQNIAFSNTFGDYAHLVKCKSSYFIIHDRWL